MTKNQVVESAINVASRLSSRQFSQRDISEAADLLVRQSLFIAEDSVTIQNQAWRIKDLNDKIRALYSELEGVYRENGR